MELTQDRQPPRAAPSAFSRLQRLAQPRVVQEHCELCRAVIPKQHQHLLELQSRQLVCACEACAILFSDEHALRYRRVPRQIRRLNNFALSEEQWEDLHIPISLAFFYHSLAANKVIAMYPSPAGATESLLPMDAWKELVVANPILSKMQSEVEALLVNRVGDTQLCFLVPIDECYKLVGLIRCHWRGFSGGKEVWTEIQGFFDDLVRRTGGASHA